MSALVKGNKVPRKISVDLQESLRLQSRCYNGKVLHEVHRTRENGKRDCQKNVEEMASWIQSPLHIVMYRCRNSRADNA